MGAELRDGDDLRPTRHRWPDNDGPWLLTLRWRVIDGRPECVEVTLTADSTEDPITATLMRQIGLPGIIAADRAAMVGHEPPVLPPGMRRSTAERLRRVAEVYRQALADGSPPVQAVAREFSIADTSASNLVARTRAAGFLPPASPGVATG